MAEYTEREAELELAKREVIELLRDERKQRKDLERRVAFLEGARRVTGGAGQFRKRALPSDADPAVGKVFDSSESIFYMIAPSQSSRLRYRVRGPQHYNADDFDGLPEQVVAESWWHLCALLGLTEFLARMFYRHPEDGQESTVAAAPVVDPKRRVKRHDAVVYCQGEED